MLLLVVDAVVAVVVAVAALVVVTVLGDIIASVDIIDIDAIGSDKNIYVIRPTYHLYWFI